MNDLSFDKLVLCFTSEKQNLYFWWSCMPGLFCAPLAMEEHASCNRFLCVKALTLLCSAKHSGAAALII